MSFSQIIFLQRLKVLYFLLFFLPLTIYAQAPGDCGQLLFFTGITSTKADCNTPNGSITLDTTAFAGTQPLSLALNGQPLTTGLTFSGLTAGGYELTVIDAKGCKDTLRTFVSSNTGITNASANGVAADCNTANGAINFGNIVSTNAGTIKVELLNTGATLNYTATSNDQFTNLLKGDYTIEITDGGGCKFKINGIHIGNKFTSSSDCGAGDDITIFEGESAFLNGHSSGTSVYWAPQTDLSTPLEASTYATPPAGKHTYTIHSIDATNCTECTDDVVVTVLPEIDPPNTFTPNGDGDNDKWVIANLNLFSECKIWIYTRWGERVFHQKGYDTGTEWDGTNNGLPLPAATYYYVIDLKKNDTEGKPKRKAGSITIVK